MTKINLSLKKMKRNGRTSLLKNIFFFYIYYYIRYAEIQPSTLFIIYAELLRKTIKFFHHIESVQLVHDSL